MNKVSCCISRGRRFATKWEKKVLLSESASATCASCLGCAWWCDGQCVSERRHQDSTPLPATVDQPGLRFLSFCRLPRVVHFFVDSLFASVFIICIYFQLFSHLLYVSLPLCLVMSLFPSLCLSFLFFFFILLLSFPYFNYFYRPLILYFPCIFIIIFLSCNTFILPYLCPSLYRYISPPIFSLSLLLFSFRFTYLFECNKIQRTLQATLWTKHNRSRTEHNTNYALLNWDSSINVCLNFANSDIQSSCAMRPDHKIMLSVIKSITPLFTALGYKCLHRGQLLLIGKPCWLTYSEWKYTVCFAVCCAGCPYFSAQQQPRDPICGGHYNPQNQGRWDGCTWGRRKLQGTWTEGIGRTWEDNIKV